MSSLDKRAEIEEAIEASISTNSLACASCLEIGVKADGEAGQAFRNLAELCAANVAVMRMMGEAWKDAWSIIDVGRGVDDLGCRCGCVQLMPSAFSNHVGTKCH